MTEHTSTEQEVHYIFSNRQDAPELQALLSMFLRGAEANRIGIMQAMNTRTNQEDIILVGVDVGPDNTAECFPLAVLLKAEDAPLYLSPDGDGGWHNPAEVEEHDDVAGRE